MSKISQRKRNNIFGLLFVLILGIEIPAFASTSTNNNTGENPRLIRLTISFDQLNGIKVGTPVIAAGQAVGAVDEILPGGGHSSSPRDANRSSSRSTLPAKGGHDYRGKHDYKVVVSINQSVDSNVKEGTVALIASPLSTQISFKESVIELLPSRDTNGRPLKDGHSVTGYSSFEKFWATKA